MVYTAIMAMGSQAGLGAMWRRWTALVHYARAAGAGRVVGAAGAGRVVRAAGAGRVVRAAGAGDVVRAARFVHAMGIVLVAAVTLMPTAAMADRRDDARRYFRRAMASIDAGQPREAIALLKKAYEARPHPDVLYNIAQLQAEVGQTRDAIRFFERYLESNPDDAAAVEARVQDLRRTLPPPPSARRVPRVRPASVAVDLSALQRSKDLMQSLATTTGSARLRSAARDLADLQSQLADTGVVRRRRRKKAPPPPPKMPAASASPGSTPVSAAAQKRDEPIYDAQIVSASRYIQSPLDAPSATHIITREEIRATGLTNVGELLRRVPGADVMTTSPADVNVSLRGFNQRLSNRLLVLVDGRSVYFDAFGAIFWHLLTINVEDIERIEVIRGPASALYGADAFAGVVNIITRLPGQGRSEIVAGGGSHAWLHEHASSTGRVGRLGYRLSIGFDNALRFSQELADARVDQQRNFNNQELAWRMVRANGAFSYRLTDDVGLIFRGGISHGYSEWQAPSGLRDFGINADANAFASAQLDTRYGLIRVFYNRIDADGGPQFVPLGSNPYRFDLSSSVLDVEALFSREFELVVTHNLQLGGSFRLKQVDWNYLDQEREERHFALFVQDTLQITDWLRFQGSFRVDFHPLLESPPISPRGALIFRPTRDSAVRLAAGTAFRTPSFLESYVDVGTNFEVPAITGTTKGSEVIGRDLEPESIFSAELSYSNTGSDFFDVEIVGYFSRVSNLAPVPIPDPADSTRLRDLDEEGVEFDPFLGVYSVASALYRNEDTTYNAIGGELSVRAYPVDGLDAYVNYAFEDISVASGEPSAYRFQDRTSQHKLNLGLRYRSPFGLDLQADFHFVSDQVWAELSLEGAGSGQDIGAASFDLPAYYMVNARMAYRLFDDQVELGVTAYNLTDNQHRQHPFGQLLGARVLGTVRFRL